MAFFASSSANSHVWETISVEFEGPFEKTSMGSQYIVVLTDLYSKWVEAKAVADKTPTDVANFILSTFSRMGFCDCKFFNMDSDFEREVRSSIHTLGSPFVQNVEKFKVVLDRILEEAPTESETRGEIRQYGYHTEMLTNWIQENASTWDAYLEGFLFKLRMGDVNDLHNVSASPFSIIYGRGNSEDNKGGNNSSQGGSWKRGRGRPRGKMRGRIRWFSNPVVNAARNESVDEEAKASSESTDENSVVKRRPGRPRKIKTVPESDDYEIGEENHEEDENCEQVQSSDSAFVKRKRGRPKKENVVSTDPEYALEELEKQEIRTFPERKYGLRTRLKAKVKTNIVKRMLKLSTHKRSHSADPNSDISFANVSKFRLKDQRIKSKDKHKRKVVKEGKYILSSVLDIGNIEKQLQVGEASIINEAGEVTVVKLVSNMLPVIDEQTAATLSIQPGLKEIDSEEVGNDDDDDFDDYEAEEDNIDDLEEEDDIEEDDDDDDDEEKQSGEENESENGEEGLRVPCSNCPGLFLGEKESILHAQFHKDGSKLLHCLYCTDVTGTWEQMQNHLLAHIDNNNAPGAATMLKKLKGSRAAALSCRRLRRKELAGTTSIKCHQCPNVRMATRAEEEVHQSCHREDSRLLRCPHCDHVSGSWLQMQVHLAVHPEVPVESYAVPIEERTCSKCFKVFATSEMVVEHQYIFHIEQRKYQCELCGKVFKERKSLARHKEIHANIVYKCGDCTYKTKIHQDLVDHQRIHQGLGFKCDLCDKVFVRQSQLHNHQEVHNKDQTVAICDQCGHQAHGLIALRYHHRDAHGVPQAYPCSQCDYVGKTKSNLKGHTDRIHNKQYKCPHCVFACLAECTLLRHIDIFHNEEDRKYPCYHCPYRARDPKCLTEHMRVLHNPHAPKIPCEFCGMEFKTKSMLRDHLPQHTGQRFICRICDYVAKYRSILYRHVKKRHPGHTLASVTKSTEPIIKQTPDGKPILPTRTRGPPRKNLNPAVNISRKGVPVTATIATTTSDEITSDPESQTTTLTVVASDNDHNMMDQELEMMKDRDGGGGDMYIATMDGETVTVDENSIVLDASLLAQAAAGGGSITLNNNMCLQIIQNSAEGEDITMQVIPSIQSDGEGHDKQVELFLFASENA